MSELYNNTELLAALLSALQNKTKIEIDEHYDENSLNAQSGVAISEALSLLKDVARTGLISDLEEDEEYEIVFQGGDIDCTLAVLDKTILE